MMKRLLTIALVLTMAFSFAACGSAPAKGETPTAARDGSSGKNAGGDAG